LLLRQIGDSFSFFGSDYGAMSKSGDCRSSRIILLFVSDECRKDMRSGSFPLNVTNGH